MTEILEAVEDTADEHALAQGISKGLDEIPTQPVDVIDAVVAYSELQSEEEGCSTEYKTVTLL